MWYTYCSTGIPELDRDHARIDDLLTRIAIAKDPGEEQKCLDEAYRAMIAHLNTKNDILCLVSSPKEKEKDVNFLRFVRGKIQERLQGLIDTRHLVSDLRHMLIVHAMAYDREKEVI